VKLTPADPIIECYFCKNHSKCPQRSHTRQNADALVQWAVMVSTKAVSK
jgi:hypothetical protein